MLECILHVSRVSKGRTEEDPRTYLAIKYGSSFYIKYIHTCTKTYTMSYLVIYKLTNMYYGSIRVYFWILALQ